ncbi:UNVERIFIED_CONTAM: hypothetical protein K2H54_029834 [Gekko kuhli]
MPAPVCLIENKDRKLVVHQEALQLLSGIHQPVVVVAIVGLYRTGKSYLMNRLAGKNSGFPLGSTVQANTKGIWMWCVPYPGRSDQTLVLLDTEGLGDVEKGDSQNDSWIFALAVLLSSTLVYNSLGIIDQQAMNQLQRRRGKIAPSERLSKAREEWRRSAKTASRRKRKNRHRSPRRRAERNSAVGPTCLRGLFVPPQHVQQTEERRSAPRSTPGRRRSRDTPVRRVRSSAAILKTGGLVLTWTPCCTPRDPTEFVSLPLRVP